MSCTFPKAWNSRKCRFSSSDKHGDEPQSEPPPNVYGDQPTSASNKSFAASVMTNNGESITHSVSRASQHHDSKFNVVLYGVDECPSGLSRSARL